MTSTTFRLADDLAANLPALIDTRLLVQANSGGGKSWCLRRILEQTHGRAQHLVIDPEGEFASLRERFDYVLAARQGGDTAADPRSAKLLAERLLELGASAILDIYELKAHERVRFVRAFLEALVDAPKSLWHPALVVVDEAHVYCLDEKTEILTASGWRTHHALVPGDVVVAFDTANSEYRYESLQAVIRREHDGEMVTLRSDGIDCAATPDHRVVMRRQQRAKGRFPKLYDWTFTTASALPTQLHVPTGGAPAGTGVDLSDDLLRLIGWVITDGYLAGGTKNILGLCQSNRTIKRGRSVLADMDDVLGRLGCKGRYPRPTRTHGKKVSGPSVAFYLGAKLSRQIMPWFEDRGIHRVPRALIIGCTRAQLEVLMQGLLEGDGTSTAGVWRRFYPGKNEGLADDFQEVALRLGISATKKLVPQQGQWSVLLSARTHHYIRRAGHLNYRGTVWCVTLPSGAFVARRNGKVFVTGNCPQVGEAESAGAVIDLATRGRKRGFCAILATQRLSKLHKDAAAECNNKLIGRTGLDVDMKRAGDELGFTKDRLHELRELEAGHFFAFGPAISRSVTRVHVGAVVTTHPKAGSRIAFTAPPPTEKVRALLPKLADLPAEAEARQKTVEDLRKELATVRRELTIARQAAPAPAAVERVEVPVIRAEDLQAIAEAVRTVRDVAFELRQCVEASFNAGVERVVQSVAPVLARLADVKVPVENHKMHVPYQTVRQPLPVQARASVRQPLPRRISESNGHLTGPEQRILDAIAWLAAIGVPEPEQPAVAFLAGYTYGGGAFNNPRGALRTKGLVDYVAGERIRLTDEGDAAANRPDAPLTAEALQDRVLERLPGPEQRLLRPLLDAYPRALTNEDLASQAHYAPNAGAFNNPRGRLRSLGLIDYPRPGHVVAKPLLFLE